MPRPPRRQLKFDEESVNKLLQEIYDESHNIKAKITRLFTKWETKVKENGEVAAIGDQIIKLIVEACKTHDKKISLLKILREIVFNNKENKEGDDDKKAEVSDERRNELYDIIEQTMHKRRI